MADIARETRENIADIEAMVRTNEKIADRIAATALHIVGRLHVSDGLVGFVEDDGTSPGAPVDTPLFEWVPDDPDFDFRTGTIGDYYADVFRDTRSSEAFLVGFHVGRIAAQEGLLDPDVT